jgi:hypothetical protein
MQIWLRATPFLFLALLHNSSAAPSSSAGASLVIQGRLSGIETTQISTSGLILPNPFPAHSTFSATDAGTSTAPDPVPQPDACSDAFDTGGTLTLAATGAFLDADAFAAQATPVNLAAADFAGSLTESVATADVVIPEFPTVPEPQTWGMMLCGAGLLMGWNGRRNRAAGTRL